MLQNLTIARQMGRVSTALKRGEYMGGIRGMVLWERNSDGPLDYLCTNHHTLSIYQGGGTRTYSCEHKAWGFKGAICLLPQGYDTRWKHNGHVRNLHLYFTAEDLERLNWRRASTPTPLVYGQSGTMEHLSVALCDHLDWSEAADGLAIDHIVLAILSQISRAEASAAKGLPRQVLARIETRLQAIELGPATLAELAQEAHMSPRHLTRLYKDTTGITLTERQRAIQVAQAKLMLKQNSPISEIAVACGFSSQSHMTRAFRRETGQTPAVWRRSH